MNNTTMLYPEIIVVFTATLFGMRLVKKPAVSSNGQENKAGERNIREKNKILD